MNNKILSVVVLVCRCFVVAVVCVAVAGFWSASAFAARGHVFDGSFASQGSGPGQLQEPSGVAVNEATHTVYVLDGGNNRVERFSTTGVFLGQFDGSGEYEIEGKIVKDKVAGSGGGEDEIETGRLAEPAGESPSGIAVDDSCSLRKLAGAACTSADPSNGDVYVLDLGHKVVDKFAPNGEYVGQITTKSVRVASFEDLTGIAVDEMGEVWLSEKHPAPPDPSNFYTGVGVDRLSNGLVNLFASFVSTGGSGAAGGLPGLAINSAHDFYRLITKGAHLEIVEYNQSGVVLNEEVLEASSGKSGVKEFVAGMTVDPCSEDLYVEEFSALVRLDAGGALLESVAIPGGRGSGVAVDCSAQTVYVLDPVDGKVLVAPPEPPGAPTVEVGSDSVSDVTSDAATLLGGINPRSEPGEAATEYRFEYGRCVSL
ncbi:MAG: hypothetical protein WAN93_08375, partial [Solirubrobacteraceae bacterium]